MMGQTDETGIGTTNENGIAMAKLTAPIPARIARLLPPFAIACQEARNAPAASISRAAVSSNLHYPGSPGCRAKVSAAGRSKCLTGDNEACRFQVDYFALLETKIL
jgi:hypothetical protein